MTVSSVTALPVLPLRDIVVFPHMIVPLFVGREKSIKALEAVMAEDKQIILATQTEAGIEDPDGDGLYTTGTVGSILQLLKLPDGAVKVLVEGGERLRLRLDTLTDDNGYLFVEAEPADQTGDRGADTAALSRATVQQFEQYIKLNKKIASEVLNAVEQVDEADKIADMIASHLAVKIAEKQDLLETLDVHERLEKILGVMEGEIGALQVEKRVRNRVKRQMEKTQREYYLNEQMKAIQKELGEGEDGMNELDEIEAQLNEMKLPKLVREKAAAELKKLRNMGPMSAEATVVRNYLDWIVALPWKKASRLKKDIVAARAVLDADHYGLDKVKDRIVEFLAVQQRTKAMRGPILCLVGPPGVGKTSLGKSIAKATGRQYVRMALGGVRDEAEIRGHRRTYIGSMPGKVLQGMKKAGMNNPLFLLDEVDKLGADWRGDPTSALLEVLDPAQNNAFQDHYMEVDFDLSNVMFVTTANTLNMPQPLMDRMEIIRLSGYTEDEKLEIAKRHLMKKQLDDHGLKDGELTISDDAVRSIIRLYTREAGVRNLEREIAKIARKTVTAIVSGKETSVTVTPDNIEDYLGVIRFRFGEMEDHDQIGVSTGLAWTEVGGELLNIEAVKVPGKGKVSATGKLGDVMKESIQAAEFFIKSRAQIYGIDLADLAKHDVHVHVPEGATPKDGPSAGVAMATSIISAITGIAIRRDVAMTGEITLRGRVLPIGGLKEKLLAAQRGGLKTVLIPKENEKDLADIPDNVKGALEIVPVAMVDEALSAALVREPVPTALEPTGDDGAAVPVGEKTENNSDIVAH
ncbi:endopeptidase La [Alphaproteobacteria bacterium]|jgi:ATP-dependent Lon protease|nr:endopeptidase La [Alphaproteobacteria bacterium]MDA9825085.1 endopeptidase La [Alphaproteobacteria bacterium]